jgi:hypothetical protein
MAVIAISPAAPFAGRHQTKGATCDQAACRKADCIRPTSATVSARALDEGADGEVEKTVAVPIDWIKDKFTQKLK